MKKKKPVRAACRPAVWRAGAVALRKAAKEIRRAIARNPENRPEQD